jgi:RNA polymerase sigma factor (sigma-70 family)
VDEDLIYYILRDMYGTWENACKVANHARMDIEDLRQVGRIAYWRAEKNFNPDRNVKLNTYLDSCIRGAIRKELRRKGNIIHVPHGQPIKEHKKEVGSLNVTVDEKEKQEIQDLLPGKPLNINRILEKIVLEQKIDSLDKTNKYIVRQTINGKTQKQISRELGISQMTVSRLYRAAVKSMKEEVV